MKTIILISTLLFLISCGSKTSSVSFKVTSSNMALSNISYQGGLVINGKGPNGDQFSQFVAYNPLSTSNELTITIPKGTWTFDAIGWTGPNLFESNAYCTTTTVDLSSDSAIVNLAPTLAGCDTHGSASSLSVAGTGIFKPLRLTTCLDFYDSTGALVTLATDYAYCNGASPKLSSGKVWARSAKVTPLVKQLGGGWAPHPTTSTCMDSEITEGVLTRTSAALRITSKTTPIQIDLYKTTNCSEDIDGDSISDNGDAVLSKYSFPNGLEFDYKPLSFPQRQDHLALAGSTEMSLFLSTSKLRWGRTSLSSLLPAISCTGGSCAPMPTLAGTDVLSGTHGNIVLLEEASETENCSSLNLTTAPTFVTGSYSCKDLKLPY